MARVSVDADRLDITARNGHTVGPFIVNMKNEDGTPIDLTGATFESKIKYVAGSTYILAEFDITVLDAPNGQLRFILDYTESQIGPQTANLKLFYYISMYSAGEKRALLNGTIDLRAS